MSPERFGRTVMLAGGLVVFATACIPPQLGRVTLVEPYRQTFPGPPEHCKPADNAFPKECTDWAQNLFTAFLGPETWRSIQEAHGRKQLLNALAEERIELEGSIIAQVSVKAGEWRPFRCAISPIPFLSHFLRCADDPEIVFDAHGTFRALVLEAKADPSPHQLMTFSFDLDTRTIAASQLFREKSLAVRAHIRPDNLPSGPIDVVPRSSPQGVTYKLQLETPQERCWLDRLMWPESRIRLAYNRPHFAYGQGVNPIGKLRFRPRNDPTTAQADNAGRDSEPCDSPSEKDQSESDLSDLNWIDLRLIDCVD